MARQLSSIDKLPAEISIEAERRLRSKRQTQLEILDWIHSLGYKHISKSALSRYATRLYNEDLNRGIDRKVIAQQDIDIVALFEELADIRNRETEILAQIQSAVLTTTQN